MERINFTNRKLIRIFVILLAIGIIGQLSLYPFNYFHHTAAFAYLTMIILWAVTIKQRIIDEKVRDRILISCTFMIALFFLRMCKYTYFPDDVMVREYIWYAYSIPLTFIPLFMFTAALYVEPVGNIKLVRICERLLIAVNILLSAVVVTNEFHSLVYRISVHPDKEYTHELFYYIVTFWRYALAVGVLIVLFRKCSLLPARKKWYIPAILITGSNVLLMWYLINGGSPKVFGHKLFQFHEALCIPFMMAFESIIQIGMIPANTGYGIFFAHSGINACIYDNDNTPVRPSVGWSQVPEDKDHRICRKPISGGYVTWVEDLANINALNREIEDVTEELCGENDLIKQENEVRAERIAFETRNRLYNRIATAVRTRAIRVNELLTHASDEGVGSDDFRPDIAYAALLSAFIKRMGNMMLLTDRTATISSEELRMAIDESFEYLRLKDCVCFMDSGGECRLPSQLALLAYELFEDTVEDVWMRLHTLSIKLANGYKFSMTIALDTAAEAITSTWHDKQIEKAGGKLSVKFEDETYYIRLEANV